MVFSILKEEI